MNSELSLIQAAVKVLNEEKKPLNIYDLYGKVIKIAYLKDQEQEDTLSKFYTDVVTSAYFVYIGDNEWDLKENHKIELWEKDGSYYKEYNEVKIPKEYQDIVEKKAKPAPVAAKPAKKVVKEEESKDFAEVVQEKIVPEVDIVSEVVFEDEVVENYQQEVFNDYEDDFDEEKYNEYMDTYEDRYDD